MRILGTTNLKVVDYPHIFALSRWKHCKNQTTVTFIGTKNSLVFKTLGRNKILYFIDPWPQVFLHLFVYPLHACRFQHNHSNGHNFIMNCYYLVCFDHWSDFSNKYIAFLNKKKYVYNIGILDIPENTISKHIVVGSLNLINNFPSPIVCSVWALRKICCSIFNGQEYLKITASIDVHEKWNCIFVLSVYCLH